MPKVLTGPLMRTMAEHIDVYLKVRRKSKWQVIELAMKMDWSVLNEL